MKIAIAQINVTVGDIDANADKILAYAQEAHAAGASLVITPELALCGYPPEDLLFRDDFHATCEKAMMRIARSLPDIALLLGHPVMHQGLCYNAASVIQNGIIAHSYYKQALPNYSVFDEERYFKPGETPLVFTHQETKIGVLICADGWEPAPAAKAKAAGAQLLISLNASPYHIDKDATREETLAERAKETGLAVVYVNLVGGQDELVFDGGSFVLDAQGTKTQQSPFLVECLNFVNFQQQTSLATPNPIPLEPALSLEAMVYQVLQLGLADYVNKNAFPGVILGLSGGIDSALTLAIAVDALGAERVKVVLMASDFTANISVEDALDMAERVGVPHSIIPIAPLYTLFNATLAPEFAGKAFDTTEENLQARIRGMLLMAMSNKFGSMVVTTGNKSEMAVGYSTLYGDMAGGFAVLKDVPKTLVYRLAHYRNTISNIIPERIITRPPSAELRADQTDQDSLPPYEVLDAIMRLYVEEDLSRDSIVQLGFKPQDVARVTTLIDRNEYKRRQSPVGVRITQRGFGKDRRYPITCKFKFEA